MQAITSTPQTEAIVDYLTQQLANICGLPKEEIEPNEPILELGIDSILAANLSMEIEKKLGIELPLPAIAEGATLTDIAEYIQEKQIGNLTLKEEHPNNNEQQASNAFDHLSAVSPQYFNIRSLPQYKTIEAQKALFKHTNVESPFYRSFDSASIDTIEYNNKTLINFASYNYLGFNHHPFVNEAANKAVQQYGTSAASSRVVSGEKNIHHQLEEAIAGLYEVEAAVVMVSGYATNVGVISHLMGARDLIIHDSLAHNSIVTGSIASKANRLVFPHNNMRALEALLKQNRLLYERVLIVVEGLYSMDGDTAPLTELIKLKKQYKCLLMVDEAHSIGVLGKNGLGLREHQKVNPNDVDIWMGTLSKSFAGCGGYIAGCRELIEYLKYSAPGFIFSVGLAPPLAGASLKAIELLTEDKTPVKTLHHNSRYFLELAQKNGFDTGLAEGYAIIPVILGNTQKTILLANQLFKKGINAQSIIYPGVEENAARLRFFISALHSEEQIFLAMKHLSKAYEQLA